MRLNHDEENKELGYESDRINLLICANCLRISFVFQLYPSTSGTRFQHKWIIHALHAATQCTRGQQILSELVMIKSNIKPQPV